MQGASLGTLAVSNSPSLCELNSTIVLLCISVAGGLHVNRREREGLSAVAKQLAGGERNRLLAQRPKSIYTSLKMRPQHPCLFENFPNVAQ